MSLKPSRSKLTPGQKEVWKIKLKGHKGEKIAAELLASMYDASLDALLDHSWQFSLYSQFTGNFPGKLINLLLLAEAAYILLLILMKNPYSEITIN